MIRIFVISVLISSITNLNAQIGFEKKYGFANYSENSYSAIELPNSNYLILNSISDSNSSYTNPYLLIIDKYGNCLYESNLHDTTIYSRVFNARIFKNELILFGTETDKNNNSCITIHRLDTSLILLEKLKFLNSDTILFSSVRSLVDNDTIIIAGSYIRNLNQIPFIVKFNKNLQIISKNMLLLDTNYPITLGEIQKDPINQIFHIISSPFSRFVVSNDLEMLNYESYRYFQVVQPLCFFNIDSSFYLGGYEKNNTNGKEIKMIKTNLNFDTVKTWNLGNQNWIDYPAAYKFGSSMSNHYFIGFIKNMEINMDFYYGYHTSWFQIEKYNLEDSLIWTKKIGGDSNYYILYDVLSTSDGGCLVLGTIYDYILDTKMKDIFVVKLDSLGNSTWISNIEIPKSSLQIFPNPTTDIIQLITSENQLIQQVEIFDTSGKLLKIVKDKTGIQSLTISDLPKGLYLIKCQIGSEFVIKKFVKE